MLNLTPIDKNILMIFSMIMLVAAVIIINSYLASQVQQGIIHQNDRIINDVDYNRKTLTLALKEIGNASKQESIDQKLDLHIADLKHTNQILNETNVKLDKLLLNTTTVK